MMRTLIPVLGATILSIGTVAADEQAKEPSADAIFQSLDHDADARLSKSEATGNRMLTEHFAAIDKDSDGYLTKREYSAHLKEMKGEPAKKDY